jgi:hypothetical protein
MSGPKVEDYQFGRIQIDGEVYQNDVIILPERVVPDWWREQGHTLSLADFNGVLEALPGTLVIGQGASGRMSVPPDTRRKLEHRGIEVLAMPTDQAVSRYNELREQETVAAALHLTC